VRYAARGIMGERRKNMKHIATIILGAITLFFGIYAIILELKGISPLDQLLWCLIFGVLTFWSRKSPLYAKLYKYLKKRRGGKIAKEVFGYFKIEKTDKETVLLGDFADKDFSHWLNFIHGVIQDAMNKKTLHGIKVENYLNLTFHICGQKVDVAIIKDGKKGPHELLKELSGGQGVA
jgi:hypothetical protein